MSEILGTKLHFIEPGESAWRHKLNMNFCTMSAVKTVTTTYTVDASPPTNCTYDNTIFCDASGSAFTITLPAESEGRKLRFIRKDDTTANAVTIQAASGDYLNGVVNGTVSLHYSDPAYSFRKGLSIVLVCEGTATSEGWWGRVLDN